MVDVREAARLAGRTPETVRRWTWTGRLRAVKDGNRLLVSKAEVLHLAGATAPSPSSLGPTLKEWAETVMHDRQGDRGASAADLVLDDRARR